jgi:hypothetical protein
MEELDNIKKTESKKALSKAPLRRALVDRRTGEDMRNRYRSAAKAESGVNPENAAAPGRGSTNGAVFFWEKKHHNADNLKPQILAIIGRA